ncbi:hypothetical protein GE061_009937 [Apolygus lucorum]|uniref:Uncharacterized protein n=1 Tax=Apolygus lucorum TaxID=248454 RepID=A0A6A4K456_APOLU|nr:hypothetical protein GE061_009937 [Apolygus lucorum]
MPKKQENTREKSADNKKKNKREPSADREPSPSPSRDSAAQQQNTKKNKENKKEDEEKCYTVKASPSHMAQCSNEQFLSSCLPLLATLSPKKNFLARINIQKALYDSIDEHATMDDDGDSDDECCVREAPRKNVCDPKRNSKNNRRNS